MNTAAAGHRDVLTHSHRTRDLFSHSRLDTARDEVPLRLSRCDHVDTYCDAPVADHEGCGMAAPEEAESELSIPVDYVPGARGHAVLAIGPDTDGAESLAVWRLGPTGRAGGAWVVRLDDAAQHDQLTRIMWMLQGRCLVGWDRETPVAILDRLADVLPPELVSTLRGYVLTIPELLTEITEHRSAYAEAVDRQRAVSTSKLAPLAWHTEVPDHEDLAVRLAVQPRAASPVAGTALALTSAVAMTAQLWQDTEQARYRRRYLRALGEPQPLPARWLAWLRAAADNSAPATI
ncbi:DUF6218 family protein [Micromonospora sp. NPDC005252]|uniref:DUF6218 family protein n=1 Tax=Micromonospora sp. NPDC005252 TaxID=3364228 RepID=UPI0036963BE7